MSESERFKVVMTDAVSKIGAKYFRDIARNKRDFVSSMFGVAHR
jgi:hypothetical protein